MSAVKSIAVVDAVYDEGGRDLRLKGHPSKWLLLGDGDLKYMK